MDVLFERDALLYLPDIFVLFFRFVFYQLYDDIVGCCCVVVVVIFWEVLNYSKLQIDYPVQIKIYLRN